MLRNVVLLVASVLLPAARRDALAQATRSDSLRIELAAVDFIRDSLIKDGVKFESRIRSRRGTGDQERSASRNDAFGLALHAEAAHQENVAICSGVPISGCKLTAGNFVWLVQPIISDRSATIVIGHQWRSNIARIPISRREYQLTLKAAGEVWRVTSVKIISQS